MPGGARDWDQDDDDREMSGDDRDGNGGDRGEQQDRNRGDRPRHDQDRGGQDRSSQERGGDWNGRERAARDRGEDRPRRSEEQTAELQSRMRISYAVVRLKNTTTRKQCDEH